MYSYARVDSILVSSCMRTFIQSYVHTHTHTHTHAYIQVILLVRNPFDAIESYFHMGMTRSHDRSLSHDAFLTLSHIWASFVPNETKVWFDFHQHWLEEAKRGVPVKVVRYEDVMNDRKVGGETDTADILDSSCFCSAWILQNICQTIHILFNLRLMR